MRFKYKKWNYPYKKEKKKTEKKKSNFRYIIDVETISITRYTGEHNKSNTGLRNTLDFKAVKHGKHGDAHK